jgi:hypothetical protein
MFCLQVAHDEVDMGLVPVHRGGDITQLCSWK